MIEVGIIGCGVIGPTHASSIALDERARVKWACDLDLDKAKARVEAERYTDDYRSLLDDSTCELVAVCTEHPAHPAIVEAALAAGKHVVCEKPLGVHPDHVETMVQQAAAAGARGQVVSGIFQHRYGPFARRLRQLLADGDFGRIESASMHFACTRTPEYYASAPWRGTWAGEGGGMLINQAIHTLDLVTYFVGTPQTVSGTAERRWLDCIDVDDYAKGRVGFADGVYCDFEAINCAEGGWEMGIEICCSAGRIKLGQGDRLAELEHPNIALQSELHALDALRLDGVKMPGKACYGDKHTLQYQDVLSAIETGRPPMVGFAEAAMTNQIVLGLYHSAAIGGGEVALPAKDYRQPTLDKTAAA